MRLSYASTGVALLAVALPASASAKIVPVIPPGNSGANQYVEVVPTSGGGQPSNSIGGGSGGGSGGGGGSAGGSGSAVAPSTGAALAKQGSLGLLATVLTRSTAPSGVTGVASSGNTHTTHQKGSHKSSTGVAPVSGPGSGPPSGGAPHRSAASEVLAALTGSATHGGLGFLLPAILVATLLGIAAFGLRRARGHQV